MCVILVAIVYKCIDNGSLFCVELLYITLLKHFVLVAHVIMLSISIYSTNIFLHLKPSPLDACQGFIRGEKVGNCPPWRFCASPPGGLKYYV